MNKKAKSVVRPFKSVSMAVAYLIPRGTPVSVPKEVVHALDNAVQTIYQSLQGGGVIERQLKRFNYTVHGVA